MFISDVPNSPPSAPVVVAQVVSVQKNTSGNMPHILGICDVLNLTRFPQADIFPVITANTNYLGGGNIDADTATISVIQKPKHGTIEPNPGWDSAIYLTNDNYLGNDSFIIKVEGNGQKIELRYFLYVTNEVGVNENTNPVCKGRQRWKISLDPTRNQILTAIDPVISNTGVTSPVWNMQIGAIGKSP